MNNLIIIPLNKKYTYSLYSTINKVLSKNSKGIFSYDEIIDFVNNRLEHNIPFLLLINKENDKVVGWCHIQPKDNLTGILGIGILKEYRNKGYGKSLIEKIIEICDEKEYIFLECQIKSKNNSVINLVKSFGFTEYNRFYNFYNKEDLIEMVLNLEKAKV